MVKLQVFDPAMCCSTGVCGPSVDPAPAAGTSSLARRFLGIDIHGPQAAHLLHSSRLRSQPRAGVTLSQMHWKLKASRRLQLCRRD